MTQMYIPPLRAKFTLLEDWTFPLWHESRNTVFAGFMKVKYPATSCYYALQKQKELVTIPAGTVMYVDRYYIKNGGTTDFDSVTFRAVFGKKTQRFWAKLADANRIQADFAVAE
jgi:hypothetical protein